MADMAKLTQEQKEKINQEVICETIRTFEKAGFTDCKIARELAIIAFSDPTNHVDIAEGGELQFKTLQEQGKARRAIKKIREKTIITESKDGERLNKISTIEFELHDKLDALGKAISVKGIQKPAKVDHTGNINVIIHKDGNGSTSATELSRTDVSSSVLGSDENGL
jgi:N-acetyl-beta-hexosaminidase